MNNLPKQILNYFATFTETRFNFRRLINYKWTNDELSLDFSLFPKFQQKLLTQIEMGELLPLSVKAGEYAVVIPKSKLLTGALNLLNVELNASALEQFMVDEVAVITDDVKANPELYERNVVQANAEALRLFNLNLRNKLESLLISLQEEVLEQLKTELRIEHVPPSVFGITNYINQQLENFKRISASFTDPESYISTLKEYFEENLEDILVYDLFFNLQKYLEFTQLGTVFIFFHNIEKESDSFPVYFIEIEIKNNSQEIQISFPRDLVLLNTPAINYFKFENVLTTPRASSPAMAKSHLGGIEAFFQNIYGFQVPFILESVFNTITSSSDALPKVKSRIGLQAVLKEDKKLLDYSELMTSLELGQQSKFSGFIDQYIKGSVPNHQEEIDQSFREKYPLNSPKRYVSDIPIPLNNSQKRILLALANSKNKIIVVDGPPGTGKSHTIAALTYWANEQKKSTLVTSHKKEALDVIDRMLTDKFKSLHPQAKPSIVRMDKETGSANNLTNTLQTSVINVANERSLSFNDQAVLNDLERIEAKLVDSVENRLKQNENYESHVKNLVALNELEADLEPTSIIFTAIKTASLSKRDIAFDKINQLTASDSMTLLAGMSLDEFRFLLENQLNIPEFLIACEKLNQVPAEEIEEDQITTEFPPKLLKLIEELQKYFKQDISLERLSTKDTNGGLITKLLGRGPSEEQLKTLLSQSKSLEFSSLLDTLAQKSGKTKNGITIAELVAAIKNVEFKQSLNPYKSLVSSYQMLPGNDKKSIAQVYDSLSKFSQQSQLFDPEIVLALTYLFEEYESVLSSVDVISSDLGTLLKLSSAESTASKVWRWIKLHSILSRRVDSMFLSKNEIDRFYKLQQKQVENLNDQRLKDLNNHLGDIARIKVSYEGGKRFTVEESKVLLSSVACIIAEPSTISKYFPMQEDLIDILIIDEASQVSIADSISLILRAKQVVIFGDEYQYGAVSAQNVSSKYSASYFSEIVSAYSEDYHASVSEAAKQELVDEVSKEISLDEQQSDSLLTPQDGTVLWLKTFNIRTSTLTFAKAIANYSTSLKEHFRSFPEIISYSNNAFYKVAQQELLINRIRTKPIGEVLQFLEVKTLGKTAQNVNIDEIETIGNDLQRRIDAGFKGSIGVITSLKEQQARMLQYLNERFNFPELERDHKMAIWFVGDVQGEERDLIYYSFVEDKELGNASLASIYPVLDGTADNIRSLKMQRLNVGFSRAKDTMVFVISQPIEKFSNTRLGDALKHYKHELEINLKNDFFVEDESVFGSPMEKKVYSLLTQTAFVIQNRDYLKIIPQFDIGKYIAQEYVVSIPKYRTDFLITYSNGGKEKTLILEYDGLEFHFKHPSEVDRFNFSQEYIQYDKSRQLELESYGYHFLRLNKFNLRPQNPGETEVDVLNRLLTERME